MISQPDKKRTVKFKFYNTARKTNALVDWDV